MNELAPLPEEPDAFQIGALVGERRTLSKLAGGCSAADAQCLRKIRESKQYLSRAKNWEEFCPKYLGIDRSTADRLIRQLEELGPESFATMQQLGLTPKQYRLLAPRVQGNALCHAGESIRLSPENAPQIHAALREIRRSASPQENAAPRDRLDALAGRGAAVVAEFRALCKAGPCDKRRKQISSALNSLSTALAQVAIDHRL